MSKVLLGPYRRYGMFVGSNEEGFLYMIDLLRTACVSQSCGKCLECQERQRKARKLKKCAQSRQPWELAA
jgi:hypothetical protein